jgi:hypothetical protein
MEFFSEQVARAEMRYRAERRGAVRGWARTEGREDTVVLRPRRRRSRGLTRRGAA